jgi:hypothetical protein
MTKIELPHEKKVGHLTLLRGARAITAKEFNALSFNERLAMVRTAPWRRKYQLILEAKDAAHLVRRLPAQEIYLLIKEMGMEDAADLLPLVSTNQLTTFLDLDCWQNDLLDGPAALRWLSLLHLEGGEEHVLRTALELDFELLVLIIKKFVTVTYGLETLTDEDALEGKAHENGMYGLKYPDSETAKIVGGFLDILFRHECGFYLHLMEAVRWEQESLLEENVYLSRSGRLQDQGFPDPFEALGVYAYFDPDTFDPDRHHKTCMKFGEEGVEAPGFILTAALPKDLLAEVLAGGISSEICWELSFLLNKIIIAERVDVGDVQQVQTTLEEVYCYLNIALEHLCGTDTEKASRLFEGVYLEPLFRLGYNLTLRLQRQAKKLRNSKIGPYLDGPFRALVEALSLGKPRFSKGIEKKGRFGERPFATLRDVQMVTEWLEQLEIQRRLFEEHFSFDLPAPEDLDLEGCFPAEAEEITLSDFFLTALANRIMKRNFLPVPIPGEELAPLHAKISVQGKVAENLRRETAAWLESLEAGAGAFGEHCLNVWEEEFCPLMPENLDHRYVGGMIIRVNRG